ncbi:hypothetical protein ACFXGA_25340 [Actinosynnema sp. NPDC059335]|uniref:hypothetical protein n=1 Tax=Actinosynnema sp. NPDC059335 TaxID=3346804 RepID=UPI0036727704
MRTSGKAAVLTAVGAAAVIGRRVVAGRKAAGRDAHSLAVTVCCPPERVRDLPEPLARLRGDVEVTVRPAAGDKGTELPARPTGDVSREDLRVAFCRTSKSFTPSRHSAFTACPPRPPAWSASAPRAPPAPGGSSRACPGAAPTRSRSATSPPARSCWYCKNDLWSLCDNTNTNPGITQALWGADPGGIFGYSHAMGGFKGSHAEYVRVPFADHTAIPACGGGRGAGAAWTCGFPAWARSTWSPRRARRPGHHHG